MGVLMKGIDVANVMKEKLICEAEMLKEDGISPCLAIVRVGERPDDLSYERGARKRMAMVGIRSFPEISDKRSLRRCSGK